MPYSTRSDMSLRENTLTLYPVGQITPLDVHQVCNRGMGGQGRTVYQWDGFGFSRLSQILYDPLDIEHPYTMYAVKTDYSPGEVTLPSYSGRTRTWVDYDFGETEEGDGKLHKYYSLNGLTWVESDDSPQSVWCVSPEDGTVVVAAPATPWRYLLPVPYCKSNFNVKDKTYLIEGKIVTGHPGG